MRRLIALALAFAPLLACEGAMPCDDAPELCEPEPEPDPWNVPERFAECGCDPLELENIVANLQIAANMIAGLPPIDEPGYADPARVTCADAHFKIAFLAHEIRVRLEREADPR